MTFGALGDVHGDAASVQRILTNHPEVPFWLCVGDVADDQGNYTAFPAPVYWIKGNNENFDAIAEGRLPANLHYLPNAQLRQIDRVTVVGLGGTFAPSCYDIPAADLPHPRKSTARATELADRRRHFVREEILACQKLKGVDVFLSHEAPRPYYVGAPGNRRGIDAGKTPINEVLSAMQPRLHLFGHHHRFTENERQNVRSVGLDVVSRSYLLIDSQTLCYERRGLDDVT